MLVPNSDKRTATMLRLSNNITISHPPSPIRKGSPPPDTRTATETDKLNSQGLKVRDVAGDVFQQCYLSDALLPGLESKKWSKKEQRWVDKIQKTPKGQETSLYTYNAPLLCLLNHISQRIFEAHRPQKALIFRFGNCKVKSPFTDHYRQPDIIVEWEEVRGFLSVDYSASSPDKTWTQLVAVGEVKVSQSGKHQLASYLRNHLQFQPELNAVLGFTARRNKWESGLLALYAFIGKLYTRPFQDQSMQITDAQAPTWAIKIGNDVYVSKAGTLEMLAGPGQRRQTGMWKNPATDQVVFIKDIWRHLSRLFFEGLLLKQAHQVEDLCGLVVHCAYGYVLDETHAPIRTTCLDPDSVEERPAGRFKMRLVTEEIGSPLNGVHSLLKFLCTMYDACVVQRNLYRKCRILHRDISQGNIMFAPNTKEYRKRNRKGYANVKFVNQVLAKGKNVKPEPACLVIDLGNGADLKTERSRDALTERTGTPKFIARSVSSGELLEGPYFSSTGVDMPQMQGPLAAYCHFMHTTEYQALDDHNPANVEFAHRLFHDAESTLWVIAWTLAVSVKKGSEPESNPHTDFSLFFYTMCNHFPTPGTRDSRLALSPFLPYYKFWQTTLHPDLAMLATMLANMFAYTQPEWAYRSELNPEHVHEALMRLLLLEIVKIKSNGSDIEIDIEGRMIPPPPPGVNPLPRCTLSSRSRDTTRTQTGRSTERTIDSQPDRRTHGMTLRSRKTARARSEQHNQRQEVPPSWSMDPCELQEPEQVPE